MVSTRMVLSASQIRPLSRSVNPSDSGPKHDVSPSTANIMIMDFFIQFVLSCQDHSVIK